MKLVGIVIAAMVIQTLARRMHLTPDQIYGSGEAYESKVKEDHAKIRLGQGLGTAEEKFFT